MTYPRETHASAYRGANCGRDKHDTHRANKTWRRSEIAPFRMEARVVTHSLTWALCRGRVRSLELCAGNCIPTLGDACYAKRGGILYVRIVCPAPSDAAQFRLSIRQFRRVPLSVNRHEPFMSHSS